MRRSTRDYKPPATYFERESKHFPEKYAITASLAKIRNPNMDLDCIESPFVIADHCGRLAVPGSFDCTKLRRRFVADHITEGFYVFRSSRIDYIKRMRALRIQFQRR